MHPRNIFITGGTGYIGSRLIPRLLERGHAVRAVVRRGSKTKLPPGCTSIIGDALDRKTFSAAIPPADTFVQLVGVAHPSPAKVEQFRSIDLVSVRESVAAAAENGVKHFVYLSVAQPSSFMREYVAVRQEGERLIRESGMSATFVRPWYVLGPEHWWPYAFKPLYWVLEKIPSTSEQAKRMGLVTLREMLAALVTAIETPPAGIRILDVQGIRTRRQRSGPNAIGLWRCSKSEALRPQQRRTQG
ncbi:MAG: NAD(P)H-binding protein [Ignavibacteriae bacterium]|nr:NAD(P)H-binding protein [Ignavibacteriota bacterium]